MWWRLVLEGEKKQNLVGQCYIVFLRSNRIFTALVWGFVSRTRGVVGFFPEGIKSKVRFFESGSVVGTVRIVHRRKRVA